MNVELTFMPKTELLINFETPQESIFAICDAARLKGKECNEVFHSIDALRTWRDRFEKLYGSLVRCVHHSNPDDPPDLTLHFASAEVGVEHTRLEPPLYGRVKALRRQEYGKQSIKIPSITFQPQSRQDLLNEMSPRNRNWSESRTDFEAWCEYLLEVIVKKVAKHQSGILVIQDSSLHSESVLQPIVTAIHPAMSPRSNLIKDWTTVIHSRSNPAQFVSYLIASGEELEIRRSII